MNKNLVKQITEFAPLVMFFIAYKYYDIFYATQVLMISSIGALGIYYCLFKEVTKAQLFSVVLLSIFGGLTMFTEDTRFLKMKPTIVYLFFALFLFIGLMFKVNFIKRGLHDKISLPENYWHWLAVQWIIFFLVCGVLNEMTWRFMGENAWIKLKVFGMGAIISIFVVCQMFWVRKYIEQK